MMETDFTLSSSLADLAAGIRAAHQAVGDALQHAIKAGQLLIEAKDKVPHGGWLPWLSANCEISERTAQAYMRVARELDRLEPEKRNAVADLSYRETLRQFSRTAVAVKQLAPAAIQTVKEALEDNRASSLKDATRLLKRDRESIDRTTVPAARPDGRRIMWTARGPDRKWLLVIEPTMTGAQLEERIKEARQTEEIVSAQRDHNAMIAQAEALEAEAATLRKDAAKAEACLEEDVRLLVELEHGKICPLTETYDFQAADDETDGTLATATDETRIEFLLTARTASAGPIVRTNHGYWGDVRWMSFANVQSHGEPWTHVGAAGWIDEIKRSRRTASREDAP